MAVLQHRSGIYSLSGTGTDRDLLQLDQDRVYVLPEGVEGGQLTRTDKDELAERLIGQGIYHALAVQGEPDLSDGHYLLLEGGSHMYTIWRLEGGLPDVGGSVSFHADPDRVLTQDEVNELLERRAEPGP